MTIPADAIIIAQTKRWVTAVVAGCGFCPFAAKEVKNDSIHYEILGGTSIKLALEMVMKLIYQLDNDETIATSLLVMPRAFEKFDEYLQLVELAENLLEKENYEGIYQLASFHPAYLFAGSSEKDPENYTNRSPYPMLHLLREASVTKAVDSYPAIESVPLRNIAFAKEKGLVYMQRLLQACMSNEI